MKNIELYQFSKLEQWLNKQNFPQLSDYNQITVDFEKVYKKGRISFESQIRPDEEGIFLRYLDKEYPGFMYIKEAFINYEGKFQFPKFHIYKCKTIQSFIDKGNFHQRYVFSTSNICDLIDKTTHQVFKNVTLELCHYCRTFSENSNFKEVKTTQDFVELLKKYSIDTELKVDVFGYVFRWDKVSQAFRESVDYTCAKCGLKPNNPRDRYFWHVDHIDGDKLNNQASNLQCLCIACHSKKDNAHRKQFSTLRMQKLLEDFEKIYPTAKE
ncbi:HNH endonuclease [Basilea psittacipulmonis]|uniref:HNH nuclease domain-containing protein n=1 Tax=Basilea psittacipulmonis DSM 24701 TaxID=1072685 RepID=A0A077DG38_9BURK|nr:HNH endonuclease signature motif containing protein [Basilea psittacipulmonis]AIL32427.1 hypothetical protein IX83_03080 [Basilea psittacipulmonis DSM 24701]